MATFGSVEMNWLEPDDVPECRRCDGEGTVECEECDGGLDCTVCGGKPIQCPRCHGAGIDPADDHFDDDAI